ncbi:MAG: alpha/beta hydrolase [Firmicutes bacterium]|nr:alpha/beta hydrolase [Bacillota bacterium]
MRKKLIALVIFILAVMGVIAIIHPPGGSTNDSSASYSGTSAAEVATSYKNNLELNWTQTNKMPSLDSYITPSSGNVYVAKDVPYCSSGDQKLLLDLYSNKQPSAGGLQPMVVYLHGGGMVEGDKAQIDSPISRVLLNLVENGFIVASVNYQLAPAYKFPAQIQDALCAMRFMRYYAYGIGGNQNKIGIFGDSVGAQLSSLAGVTSGVEPWENSNSMHLAGTDLTYEDYLKIPSKPNAVVHYYGSSQLPESPIALFFMRFMGNWHDPWTGQDRPLVDMMKEIYPDSTAMHEAGAINYVTAGEPPFLIVQGDKDKLNPENLSTDLYNKLKSYRNSATLVIVQNADHGLVSNPPGSTINPSLDSIVNTTVSFLESNLK